MKKAPVLIEKLLNVLPLLLALFVPIFFLPLTTEFFEFNKLALIAVATGLMLVLWIFSMFFKKSVEVVRSSVDLSVFAVVAVIILSTIFSLNKTSSIFGAQGRWFPSLFGVLVLVAFYYVTATKISSLKAIKTTLSALLLGITVSSIVAILSYFGIKLGAASYFQAPNFTLTGSTIVASVLASLGVVLALARILGETSKGLAKALAMVAVGINFVAVALMGSLPSWVVLFVGALMVAYFVPSVSWVKNKSYLGLVALFILATITLLAVPVTRGRIVNSAYPQEVRVSPRESWIVASSVIRDFPVLGTGLSTFGLNYTRYKPLSVNTKDYWNVRFDKPYSEAFDVISAMGIVGVALVLGLGIKTLRYSLRTKESAVNKPDAVAAALAAGLVSILVLMLFAYATVTTAFLLALFLALTTAANRLEGADDVALVGLSLSSLGAAKKFSLIRDDREVFQYFVAIPLLALVLAGGYYLYRQYAGEYFMRKALLAARDNDGTLTYKMQQKAIKANPARDTYQISFANTNLALANAVASKGQISDDEKNTITKVLIPQAIASTKAATEVLNPMSAANWEMRANVYRSLNGVAGNALDWSIKSYNTAIQLDPTNPQLRVSLGGVYFAQSDYLSAANLFKQATSLKSDYANAHYNFAQALVKLQNYPQAQLELQAVQKLVKVDSPDYQKVAAQLDELSKLPNVAGAATTAKPTVEQLEGTEQQTPPASQEALQNVGEKPSDSTLQQTSQ